MKASNYNTAARHGASGDHLGFSLLELMLVLTLITILVIVTVTAFTPTKHRYETNEYATAFSQAIRGLRSRAIKTGLCHEMAMNTYSTNQSLGSRVTLPANFWGAFSGASPLCPKTTSTRTSFNFGNEEIVTTGTFNGTSGADYPYDAPSGMLSEFTAHSADFSKDSIKLYGISCCIKGIDTTCNSQAKPDNKIYFFFNPNGTIQLLPTGLCTDVNMRYTLFIGASLAFNNVGNVVASGAQNITEQQYRVLVNGRIGTASVEKGW